MKAANLNRNKFFKQPFKHFYTFLSKADCCSLYKIILMLSPLNINNLLNKN